MGKRVWLIWMALGAVTCAAFPLLPPNGVPSTCVYNGVGVVTFGTILVAIRRHRPARARAWYAFAAGMIVAVAGDVCYEVSGLALGVHPYPYWNDALYFAAYPMLWTGLLFAVRRPGRRDLAGLIDAAVIAVAVGLVYWVFVIAPALHAHGTPLLERLVTVGYPVCDVLTCAVVARLLTRGGARTPSLLLLAAGAGLLLACDVVWTLTSAFGTGPGSVVGAGIILGYVCWGGAALHPSMRDGGPAVPPSGERIGRRRIVLLAGGALLVPGVLFVQGFRHDAVDWAAVGTGSVLLFVLVLTRMSGFVVRMHRQSAQLVELAMQDELTGLANRRRIEQRLAEALATGSPQVCMLDLDGFKGINDRLGPTVGDRLLVAVAHRLAGAVRGPDLVARMGGDEFAVLVPDATVAETDRIVERLAEALRRPVEAGGHELLVTAGIGVADAAGTGDPAEVLRRADVAMHAAKTTGSAVRRYGVELDDRADEQARLGAEIRVGLDTGQFRMVYQPIVGLPDGETRYVESLVRWQHPTRGLVAPAEFVPVAEQNGLIVELGEWILRTACAQFVRWQVEYGSAAPERISVNVSARQLAEPGFATVVADVLRSTGIAAHHLIVEVTETAVFGGGAAQEAVHEIHRLGVRIALDDFGTGHSSLGLLQTVPVDVLKVDKSFVDNLTMAGRHAVIATALIQVSNGLGLVAVAEGVETAEQAAELHRLGYQLAQGYHFARPVADPIIAITLR